MAKASFDCAECGASVQIVGGNRSEADRKAEWHEAQGHICAECESKHRAEENAKAAEANKEIGLPSLTGSEKQTAWAETIRKDMLERAGKIGELIAVAKSAEHLEQLSADGRAEVKAEFAKLLSGCSDAERYALHYAFDETIRAIGTAERYAAFLTVLRGQTRASWWIDNRDIKLARIATNVRDDIDHATVELKPVTEEQKEIVREAQEEALLLPSGEPNSTQIAEISLVGKQLRVAFPEKNETFRLLMRGAGFVWADKFWARATGITTGNPVDRMAETAHRILGAGFMARVHDEDARSKAVSGQFEPEQTRWITRQVGGSYDGWCRIQWPKSDGLYAPAKRILGARYKDGNVYCPPGSVIEVQDFAEHYGFAMSPGVIGMLEAHRAALAVGVVVADIKQPAAPLTDDGSRPELNAKPGEIDESLKD
jgi:hypothetical protein